MLSDLGLPDERSGADALGALAPHLPPELLAAALETARSLQDEGSRANALGALAPHLPASEQPAVYAAALETARSIQEEWRRDLALGALAPHLSPELLAAALETARSIQYKWSRADALGALAPNLSIHRSSRAHWCPTVRTLAARGRPAFLSDLTALTPWLATLATPEELQDVAIAIRDVARCWP